MLLYIEVEITATWFDFINACSMLSIMESSL
jgi:hypothetical protein